MSDPIRQDTEHGMAARLHDDVDVVAKRTAAACGVTTRSVTRWRRQGKGSPAHRFASFPHDSTTQLWMATNPDPWRLVAHAYRIAVSRTVETWTDAEVVAQIRTLLAQDAVNEGAENAARSNLTLNSLDRAQLFERDATDDLKLAALTVELAARRIPWEEVYRG